MSTTERMNIPNTINWLNSMGLRDIARELGFLSAENEALRSKAGRLARWESAIGEVMMPDLKDWHDNDQAEWPDIAAGIITTLREQRDEEVELSGQLATQLATQDAELATLRAQVDADNLRHLNHTRMIKGYQDELAALNEKVDMLNSQVTSLTGTAVDAVEQLINNNNGMADVMDAVAAEIDRLRAQVEALTVDRSAWFALVMNAAGELKDAHNCLRDPDAKRSAASGAAYYRNAANVVWYGVDTPSPLTRPAVPEGWKHDCAALLSNDVELWIDACPHCGKPRPALAAAPQPEATIKDSSRVEAQPTEAAQKGGA